MRKNEMRKEEKEFANNLDSLGKRWIYNPEPLDTGKPCRKWNRNIFYHPHFYCIDDDCYYEIVFTRQSHEVNMRKIRKVLSHNKDIKIKSVWPNGEEYRNYSYDEDKYITIKTLAEMFSFSNCHICSLLKKNKIQFNILRSGEKIFERKKAIQLIKKQKGKYYPLDSEYIKKTRMKYKITIANLADELGIHWVLLSKYENGYMKRTKNKKIAEKLNNLENFIKENLSRMKTFQGRNNRSFDSYYWRKKQQP